MIKASELRIGNWVQHNNRQYKITGRDIFEIEQGQKGFCLPPTADAIPLAPEVLEACGFSHEWSDGFIIGRPNEHGQYFIRYDSESNRFQWEFRDEPGYYIESLHQVQNLFFALTGTELTYQPKPQIP